MARKNKRPGKGSKGGPHFSKRQREVESTDMKGTTSPDSRGDGNMHTSASNDWRWYAQSPQLVQDFASYPFGYPVGNGISLPSGNKLYVPGAMVYDFVPTIGVANNENSPINVAMRKLYSYVRHANSGSANYDAPDLMLYLVCVDSALMYLQWMKRIYGCMRNATPYNRYYPVRIISAMGVDYDDLSINLNDFRGYINIFASKLNQLWIPNSMSYMARHAWMVEGLYTDSNTFKAQTYFYNPSALYVFTLSEEGVGSAQMTRFPSSMKLTDVIAFGNSILNPMIANEDFGIMSGDILKAFGASGIVQIQGITEEYRVLPVYNQEVLSQMENIVAMGNVVNGDVTQATSVGTGYLTSTPRVELAASYTFPTADADVEGLITAMPNPPFAGGYLLNMHHDGVLPPEVMVATRLMFALGTFSKAQSSTGTNNVLTADVLSCGSEIVEKARMIGWSWANGKPVSTASAVNTYIFTGMTTANFTAAMSNIFNKISQLAQFDWHMQVTPKFVYDGAAIFDTLPNVDLDNYTFVDNANLSNMHGAALLSEFSIPQI